MGNARGGRLAPLVPALDLLRKETENFIPEKCRSCTVREDDIQ